MVLAHEMITRTRVYKLLQGYRQQPRADIEGIALTLVKLSQLVSDLSEVVELDINPLFASERGVLALDARLKVREPAALGSRRLAIRPYPKRLERPIHVDGRDFTLRPIRPEDEPRIQDMLAKSNPEDIRMRFFAPLRQLTHEAAARLSQIDYDREMALVATEPKLGEGEEVLGVSRISADPDNERAEYGVMVRSDLKGIGLGYRLMAEIIAYARSRGIGQIFGEVLRENTSMLEMCEELGFDREIDPDDHRLIRVTYDLREEREAAEAASE
jgi:acetyltransferase